MRRRRRAGVGLFVTLIAVFLVQLYWTRTFWVDAWERGTLFPSGWPWESLDAPPRPTVPEFDLSRLAVPEEAIFHGGPPKDSIRAISNPEMVPFHKADYLRPDDRVIGVVLGGEARAYPLRVLTYREIVNDRIGEVPVAITYCPLCDSSAIFDRRTPLGECEFGVSGRLYNSNVLMFDRGSSPESLWSQMMGQGISGPAVGKPLTPLPLEVTTWSDWLDRHPMTRVLWAKPGTYLRNPYSDYFADPEVRWPMTARSDALPAKERILGLWTKSAARAYPESAFSTESTRIEDEIDGSQVIVEFNAQARSLRVVEAEPGVNWMYSFWFAWYAFHPETGVFEPTAP